MGTMIDPAPRSPTTIRRAQAGDAAALTQIYLDTARHFVAIDPSGHVVPHGAAAGERIQTKLAEATEMFVAEVAGEVVGVLELELVPSPPPGSLMQPMSAVQVGLAVRADRRGTGLGTALMRFADRWATEHDRTTLILDVSAANQGAQRLYERLGYHVYGLAMRKPVDSTEPP